MEELCMWGFLLMGIILVEEINLKQKVPFTHFPKKLGKIAVGCRMLR